MVFPFITIAVLEAKFAIRYHPRERQQFFDSRYDVLYTDLKVSLRGFEHYYTFYLGRKLIYALIVFHLSSPDFALF